MTDSQKILTIEDFVEYASNRLGLNKVPQIKFVTDRDWAVKRRSFGQYDPNDSTLVVYIGNRNTADILRTLGHELIHHKQNEAGRLENGSGKTGSEIENEANALAGILMRDYGKMNDTIYESVIPSLKEIYEAEKSGRIQIYCDMDGVLCDFDSRFEHYYGVPPREYAKEKGQKGMEDAVNKVGVAYWSKMPWLAGGKELWNKISKYDPIILTSPGKFEYAKQGKLEWIKENLNPQPKDIMFASTGNKYQAIKDKTPQEIKRSMLIDDYYPNIAPWKEVGGIGIMYKSYDQVSSILDKFRLKEVAYPSLKSDVNYDEDDNSLLDVEYTFKTDKNKYRVEFSSKERPREFDVSFGIDTGDFNKIDTFQMTGEGDARNILQTVSEIINKFYNQYSKEVDRIIVSGTDEKRTRVYNQLLSKYLSPEALKVVTIKTNTLAEIGDASVKAFPWTRKGNIKTFLAKLKKEAANNYKDLGVFSYEVTSPNATYMVKLGCYMRKKTALVLRLPGKPVPEQPKKYEMLVYIAFNTKGSKTEKTTNLNEQYGLMSTVIECISDFISNLDDDIVVDELSYKPKADTGKDTDIESKRAKLYLAFLKQNINKLPGKWTAFSQSDRIAIRPGDWTTTGSSIVAKN